MPRLRDVQKKPLHELLDGKLHLKPVEVGLDDGIRAEILSGLSADDRVVARPGSDLAEGAPVEAEEAAD